MLCYFLLYKKVNQLYIYTHPRASQVTLVVKNPPANAGDIKDTILIPGSGRYPGGGYGNPLQYSCLENPMDRGAWWATVHRVTQSQTQRKQLSMQKMIGKRDRKRRQKIGVEFFLITEYVSYTLILWIPRPKTMWYHCPTSIPFVLWISINVNYGLIRRKKLLWIPNSRQSCNTKFLNSHKLPRWNIYTRLLLGSGCQFHWWN